VVEELQRSGYPVEFGSLGENLTTRGIDVHDLRIGDRMRAGGALARNHQTARTVLGAGYLRARHQAGNLRPARESATTPRRAGA
jgi:hypothetical protein